MLAYIRKPHADLAALMLRIGLGFLFIGYGYIKLYQERAISEVMSYAMQQAVGWLELVCGVLLTLGLFTRLAALGVIVDMIGAIVLVTGKREFFSVNMGPHGETFQPGFEYNTIIILVCLALIALSSGWFSLDRLIFGRKKEESRAVPPSPAPLAQGQSAASEPNKTA